MTKISIKYLVAANTRIIIGRTAFFSFFVKDKTMRESQFQRRFIRTLEERFPGCVIIKNDPNYIQGIPDLLVLFEDKWAMLEVKRSKSEPPQPNQEYYVSLFASMSYSAFVCPENEEIVLYELQSAFCLTR